MRNVIFIVALFFTTFSLKAVCAAGDCENGFGTYVWEDGSMYSGFWKDGKKHYFGMNFWPDGDFWYGLYKNNERKPGFGIYVWDDGDFEHRNNRVYYNEKGCVSGNCENGWGVYIYNDGDLHAGFWRNGKQQYFGAKFWASGDFYFGLYKEGKRSPGNHGYYVFKDGESKVHLGTRTYSNSGCVQGDCENGFGTYIWQNGDVHTGYWKKGKAHFIGLKFWKEKDFFMGLYKDGERIKRGLYIFENAQVEMRTNRITFDSNEVIQETKWIRKEESDG